MRGSQARAGGPGAWRAGVARSALAVLAHRLSNQSGTGLRRDRPFRPGRKALGRARAAGNSRELAFMIATEPNVRNEGTEREALPLSLLNDFLYCPRRAALKIVEGWREENEHTVRGDIVHEHADLPGYEVAKGVKVLRALPVFSDRLGLSGKCDVVEAVLSAECRV